MENITITQFLAYFNSWYPLIIPCVALLVATASFVLDWVRAWVVAYVDDNESGPYKMYVEPFLRKLFFGDEPTMESVNQEKFYYLPRILDWFDDDDVAARRDHVVVVNGHWKYAWVRSAEDVDMTKKLIERFGAYGVSAIRNGYEVTLDGIKICRYNTLESTYRAQMSEYQGKSVIIRLLVLSSAMITLLTAYKFLPSITVGCVVGYGVLRLARSTVRLGKRLKAHITDPNAHKGESSDE